MKRCIVLHNNGGVVGIILDPHLDPFDVEILLGIPTEEIDVEPESPIADIISRIKAI